MDSRVAMETREVPLAVGGPSQPFWLTSTWLLRDGEKSASSLGAVEAIDSLAVNRWLSVARGSLHYHEQLGAPGRAVRALPNACDVRVLGVRGGAWVVYRRASTGCFGDASHGPLAVLHASANGQQFELFSPLAETQVRTVHARLDSGRIVIETQLMSLETRSTVLDLEGTVLAQPSTAGVVCPRVGCLALSNNGGQLQFRAIDAPPPDRLNPNPLVPSTDSGFSISTANARIAAVAVHDNLVFVVQQESNSNRHTLALVDTLGRRIETVFDSRSRAGVDIWRESVANASFRVTATERGFAYIASGSSGELVAREVDCEL